MLFTITNYYMHCPFISIIIAVYNAEKYLSRCIKSIQEQDFSDYEVLLIDDGSTDNSRILCEQFAQKDSRFLLFHKKNEGVSATRQFGIDHSNGLYTIHVDPDDWIEPHMLSSLYKEATKSNSDVIITDYFIEFKNKTVYKIQKPLSLSNKAILNNFFNGLHGSCCNKLIKKDIYDKYNIKYPHNTNYCEDLLVCLQIYQHPVKTSYLPQAFYHYDQVCNADSITRKYNIKTIEQHLNYIKNLRIILSKYPQKELVKKGILIALYDEFSHNAIYYPEFNDLADETKEVILQMNVSTIGKYLFYSAIQYNKKFFSFIFRIIYKLHTQLNR